jgi:TonB-linked SusC/RagA family outer membrane protein
MKHTYPKGSRTPVWLLVFVCLFVAAQSSLAQSVTKYTVKGTVTDAIGQPLTGVTIRLNDSPIGTITALDGGYTLSFEAPTGPRKLSFSSLGFLTIQKDIVLTGNANLTVNAQLQESSGTLNEVVVIGSTISAPKRELGNQINTIKANELTKSGSAGLINSLQGKVPGAQITQNSGDPAGGVTVRLRGVKSLIGASDPLYVIDGVIVSNQSTNVSQLAPSDQVGPAVTGQNRLADINPEDIETINVINGAAAAAQYGSRAANGVVLITTKRGKAGTPRITFSTSYNVNELRKGVAVNTFGKQFGFPALRLFNIAGISAAQIAANPGTTVAPIVRDGAGANLATNLVDVTRYNYFDQIFRTGTGTDNSLSISGGTDKTKYIVSAGYLTNQGIVKGTDFTRYNLRARVDQQITDWMKLSAGLQYNNSFTNEKANGNVFYSPINSINITNNIYDITQRDAAGNLLAVEPTRVNPLSTIEDMTFTQSVNRTIGDVQLNIRPIAGLSIDYILGVDAFGQVGKNYIRPYPYQAVAGLPAARYPGGFAATANNAALLFNTDLNISYERQLTNDLKLNAIAGYQYQYNQQDYSVATGENLAPFIETIRGASSTTVRADYSLDRFDLSGYFAQATVGFRNVAYLTGAVRQDRSSKFSASQTNQLYPKISTSVVLSDLGFWKKSGLDKTINEAKIRASYGEAGNLNGIGSYDRFYQFNPVGFLGRNTIVPGTLLANPEVRPERMGELEAGIDLSFLDNRFGLSFTTYNQKITDLVVRRTLAPSTGGTSIVTNVGSMENRGIELMLNATPIRTNDLTWDVTVIFNRNRNKILDLGGLGVVDPGAEGISGAPVRLLLGQPASVFYGTGYARDSNGNLILTPTPTGGLGGFPQSERAVAGSQPAGATTFTPARTAEGQPLTTAPFANIIIGNPNPDWTGSISSNLMYKNLSFRFLLDAVQGVDVFNADRRTRQGVGLGGELAEQELRGTVRRGYTYAIYNTQEYRVESGAFTKLREVSLGYTFDKFPKPFRSVNIAAIGRNLYSWDTYTGFDPETNAGGNSDIVRGVDFGNVPIPRTYQFRLTATF